MDGIPKNVQYEGVIKNYDLLDENSREIDLLKTEAYVKEYYKKLLQIKKSGIIGFIGEFGVGKSNFLNQVKQYNQLSLKGNVFWFEFNAWKYPNRDDLRENFILEFGICTENLDKILRKIEKKGQKDVGKLFEVVSKIPIPGMSMIKDLDYFLDTTPIKRIWEYQALFASLILERDEKEIYIIIEDIDRSGDKGIFFLETLNNFLQTNVFNKKVVVITPVGSDIFNEGYSRKLYLKAFDYFHIFPVIQYDFSEFVQEIFREDCELDISMLKEFLQEISKETESINIRIIKHCIREANLKCIQFKQKYPWVAFEIFLMVELSRFLSVKKGDKIESLFETYKRGESINNKCFEALLIAIDSHEDSLYCEGKLHTSDEINGRIRRILFGIGTSQSIHQKRLEGDDGKGEAYNLVISNIYLDGISEQEKESQLKKMSGGGGFKAISPNYNNLF